MNLYNMMQGVNPATFWILPMLGKHPNEYPRFRDCFAGLDDIHIYTRVGGPNRGQGYGEEQLEAMEGFVQYYEDPEDCTYGTYAFKVPERWMDDFVRIMRNEFGEISKEYREEMKRVFPKLAEKFEEIWGGGKDEVSDQRTGS